MKKLLTSLVWVLMLQIGYTQIPGTPDLSFNPAENSFLGNGPNGRVMAAVQQPDGKFIIGGYFTQYNGITVNNIARINLDGSLDQSFIVSVSGASSNTTGEVRTLVLQADGKIIIGGSFATINSLPRPNLARINSNGSIDEGFNPGGAGPNQPVNACLLLPNDSIVIGGRFSSYNSLDAKLGVAFLGSNGISGPTVNPSDTRARTITDMVLQPDGKILISGDIFFRNNAIVGLARLNANRTLDNTLADFSGQINTMALQPDGKILVAGRFVVANGQISPGIQRLLPGGSRDATFNPGTGFRVNIPGVNPNAIAYPIKLYLQEDGKILVAGQFSTYNDQPVGPLFRINANGSLDPSFTLSNEVLKYDPANFSDAQALSLIKTQNGKFLMGGIIRGTNINLRVNLFLINPTGSIDRSFNPNRGFTGDVLTTLVQPNGRILAGGNFTAYNDTVARSFTRLMPDGTLDRVFNNQMAINGPVFASALQTDGKILIAGKFTMVQGVRRNSVARLNSNGSLDAGFNMGAAANDSIKAIAVRPDGNIVVAGAFTRAGGMNASRIILLAPNGNPIAGFGGKGVNNTINDLVALPDSSVVFGGRFDQFDGLANAHLVKLSKDNKITILNPAIFQGVINCIKPDPEGRFVIGGKFSTIINGVTQHSITKLPVDSTNVFDPGTGFTNGNLFEISEGEIINLIVQPDGKIIAGGVFAAYKTPDNRISFNLYNSICRILPNGNIDNSFRISGLNVPFFYENMVRLNLLTNGNVLVIGPYSLISIGINPVYIFSSGSIANRRGIASINAYNVVPNELPCNAINLSPGVAGAASCASPVSGTILGTTLGMVWYKFTATSTSHFIKVTYSPAATPSISLFKVNCNGNIVTNSTRLSVQVHNPANPSEMVMNVSNLTPDSVYYIQYSNPQAFASSATEADYNVNICVLTPGNDDPCGAIDVAPKAVGDTSSAGATVGTLYPSTFSDGTSNANIGDVWYKFKATSTSHIIRAAGNGFQVQAGIFRGSSCGQMIQIGSNVIGPYRGGAIFFSSDTLKVDSIYYLQFSSVTRDLTPGQAGLSFSVLTPQNNTPCTAAPIVPGLPADTTTTFLNGDNFLSTFNNDLSCSRSNNPDVWYKFTATANSHLLELEGPLGVSMNATLYTDTLCQSRGYTRLTCLEGRLIKMPLNGLQIGKSYLIRVASAQSTIRQVNFKLRVLSPPVNDEPCGATTLLPGLPLESNNPFFDQIICSNPVTGTFVGSTKDNRFTNDGFSSINHDVWFKFIATATTHIINIRRNNYSNAGNLHLSLYKGSNCDGLYSSPSRLIYLPTDNYQGSLLFGYQNLVVGETYFIRLGIIFPGRTISIPFDICVLTPINDTRQTATEIIPTNNGTTKDIISWIATPDSVSDPSKGIVFNDIWYRFKATSKSHTIRFSGVYPIRVKFGFIPANDSVLQVYDSLIIDDREVGFATIGSNNLIPDSTYYIVIAMSDRLVRVGNSFSLFNPQNHSPENALGVAPGALGDTSCASPVSSNFSFSLGAHLPNCDNITFPKKELWYHFKATSSRHFLRYSGPNASVRVYDSTNLANIVNLVYCDSIPGGQGRIQVLNGLITGQSYYLVFGSDNTLGDQAFSFCLLTPPATYNDEPCNAIPITQCNITTGHVLFATTSMTADCGGGKLRDVWYKFVVPNNGFVSVEATEKGFNPAVRFIKIADCAQPDLGTGMICFDGPGQSELIDLLNLSPGEEYFMAIGYSDKAAFQSPSSGRFNIRITATNNTLVSISHNQTSTICQGTPVTFIATPTNGGPNPTFQWLLNGNNVGTNSSSFISDSLKQGDTVRCRLTSEIVCTSPVLSNKIGLQIIPLVTWFKDADNDGFGDPEIDSVACTQPVGYIANNTDCNDAEGTIHATFKYYTDADEDGFGIEPLVDVCAQNGTNAPRGYSLISGDTDDNNARINPNAPAAEYFVDKDPGIGKGLPINFTVVNDSILIEDNIPLDDLHVGFHTLGIRILNAGNWSLFETRGFYVDTAFTETMPIVSAEYYFDSDPGTGKASAFFPEIFGDTASASISVPTGALTEGFHFIGIRTLDQSGKWSLLEPRGFYVDSSLTLETQPLVEVEYYMDTDPGVGKGTSFNLPASDTIELRESIGASLLTPGFHLVTVRSKSTTGHWGLGEVRGFYVQPAEASPNPITAAEYFLSQDAGPGNGFTIAIPQPADTIKGISPLTIPNSVTVGTYLLGLRVKDLSGAWSLFETDTVTITSNATNLSIPFTQICAGLSANISFTANGPYNNGNVFTAQLSNGFGDFTNPINIGSIDTTGSGSFSITIPLNTAPGLNYRIRIASSSPASASVISGNGFAISGALTPADANTIQTLSASETSHLVDANCRMITSILPNGELPVSGSVSAKVWVEDNVPLNNGVPYVSRHYEITPNLNGSIATARVTLYFTQQEFDAYNNHPNTNSFERLPASPSDAVGKANLLIFKYSGSSSDGSGLPSTYPNDIFVIDPADENIVWNETLQRWEVSFDVTGFSGFMVSTSPSFINGPTILYTNWIGNISEEWEDAANWSHGVPSTTTIAIIPAGRPNYPTISVSTTVKGVVTYEGTTVIVNDGVVVTIKGE